MKELSSLDKSTKGDVLDERPTANTRSGEGEPDTGRF